MRLNLILAGVGGQGILTIAKALSLVAMRRGLHIKQAEAHGMSQRGGAVVSHLRFSDEPIASDLIPEGGAEMVVATDPLESLRYVHYLRRDGVMLVNAEPFVNIPNYPELADVLGQVAAYPRHLLVDADRLAKAAGSRRSANIVVLGAASCLLRFEAAELEAAVRQMFAAKGERVVDGNVRAFGHGRRAGAAYLGALATGAPWSAVHSWVAARDPELEVSAAELEAAGLS